MLASSYRGQSLRTVMRGPERRPMAVGEVQSSRRTNQLPPESNESHLNRGPFGIVRANMPTVDQVIRRLFPHGTTPRSDLIIRPAWGPPVWAPDAFAICARLIELSGCYH